MSANDSTKRPLENHVVVSPDPKKFRTEENNASPPAPTKSLPTFQGDVHLRPPAGEVDQEYEEHAYQYATSSFTGSCKPAAIIYAKKDPDNTDIITAIKYAKDNNLSIAVRSGGHQYLGYSSTQGENIQIDMSDYNDWSFDKEAKTLEIGVAWRLSEISQKAEDLGIFFPHGECSHVAVGGHLNTGGYSVFSRSFGLFIDFVQWFDIITADGILRRVHKPDENIPIDDDNNDLWFAVLGGSPGNYGIVLRMQLNVIFDSDYPESRGMFKFLPFTKECLHEMLTLVEETNDDPDIPADYTYSVIAISDGHRHRHEFDESIRTKYPQIYGERFYEKFLNGFLPSCIIVCGLWTGVQEKDPKLSVPFFEKIEKMARKHYPNPILHPLQATLFKILNTVMGISDTSKHIPLSKLSATCCWRYAREFDLPFQKRVWAGTATDLKKRGLAKWASDKAWELEGNKKHNGCKFAGQWISGGGKHSRLGLNAVQNRTALGHRRTNTSMMAFDCFYRTVNDTGDVWREPFDTCMQWIDDAPDSVSKSAIGKDGCFSTDDFRYMYAPFSLKRDDPQGHNVCLDSDWQYYYDDKSVYERLLQLKLKFDPHHVFTPNMFCVGFTDKIEKEKNRCLSLDAIMVQKKYKGKSHRLQTDLASVIAERGIKIRVAS